MKEMVLIPRYKASEEAYEKASFEIVDPALEAQCQRRGIRMAFLTLAAIFGFDSLKLIHELHGIMTEPMTDQSGNPHELDETLFLRMTYWSVEAENDVRLYSDSEQAFMERSAMELLGDYQPLTQERYEAWREALLMMKVEDNATGQNQNN